VYRLGAVPHSLVSGTLVVLPVPAVLRPWQARWVPLLKPVAAVAGETVCLVDGHLWVGDTTYGPVLTTDTAGRPLPQAWVGCQAMPPQTIFVASQAPRSLDSRYFGAVPLSAISAVATPLWTWR
jgi:type IV secretory pathway protease TraF